MEYLEADEFQKEALEVDAPTQLEKIIKNGYKGLGLEYFFTSGEDEVRVSFFIRVQYTQYIYICLEASQKKK